MNKNDIHLKIRIGRYLLRAIFLTVNIAIQSKQLYNLLR
eukprot:SAG31_NODE_397_length_16251_cov_7.922486_2_plen_39_part_00